jgi:c-di-GMP-binding flagellar brake protein YcgR
MLDKRKHDRVVITLPGVFVRYNKGKMGKREQMLVLDLSLSGLKFMMKRKCNIEVGEELMVEFNLNDKKKSLIKAKVIARHIKNREVGAEFCSKEQQINISPYLEGLR